MDNRKKNANWNLGEVTTWEQVAVAVLMDIRDEMQSVRREVSGIHSLANCYRIPRALDAMHELGAEARRKKRAAAAKRKAART